MGLKKRKMSTKLNLVKLNVVKKSKIEHLIFKDGGHMFPLEKPQLVAKIITDTIRLWEQAINTQ